MKQRRGIELHVQPLFTQHIVESLVRARLARALRDLYTPLHV